MKRTASLVVALLLAPFVGGCGGGGAALQRSDGLDPNALPSAQRADYAVFAQRCSKCHSLSRPLESGIDDDEFWTTYVAKMRRMPGSGISPDDTVAILRFLHYFSQTEHDRKARRGATAESSTVPTDGGTTP